MVIAKASDFAPLGSGSLQIMINQYVLYLPSRAPPRYLFIRMDEVLPLDGHGVMPVTRFSLR